MKKRYGVGIGAILVLGFLLGKYLNLPGLGGGSTGDSVSMSQNQDKTESEGNIRNVSVSNDRNFTNSNAEIEADPQPLIIIAVDADKYRLTTDEDPTVGQYLSLGEVIAKVTKTTGTENGIRLRILFHKNAQEGAISDLHDALTSAGIKREEIQETTGYID